MEILVSSPRQPKRGHALVLAGAVLCLPAALAWGGAVLYVIGIWRDAADLLERLPLWALAGVLAGLPLVAAALGAIGYVRQLRIGHGDWRLLGVIAIATALTVGTAVAAFTLLKPEQSSGQPTVERGGGRAGGGGGGGRRR